MSNNQPIHEIRLGPVKAVIWENDTDKGIRHNVSVARLYKDGDEWATTQSFGRNDLPLLSKVADLAHTWIYAKIQDGLGGSDNGRHKHSNRSKRDR